MSFRDLTIRVLGDFPNDDYACLAYDIGLRLRVAGLADRAILVTDGKISGPEMDAPHGPRVPDQSSRWRRRYGGRGTSA